MSNLKTQPLPPVSDNLAQSLDKKFPEESPDPSDSEREVWMKAGERRVVKYILEQNRRQNETALE